MPELSQLKKRPKLVAAVAGGVIVLTGVISLAIPSERTRIYHGDVEAGARVMADIEKARAEAEANRPNWEKIKLPTEGEQSKNNQPESDGLAEWAVRQAESSERHDNECWDQIQSGGVISPNCIY